MNRKKGKQGRTERSPAPPPHKSQSFFSSENLHRFWWGLLIATITFCGTQVVSHYKGQGKIIVATPSDGAQPLVVRVEGPKDNSQYELQQYIQSLVHELKEFRSARKLSGHMSVSDSGVDRQFNLIQIPPFEMPAVVGGYSHETLVGLAEVYCPPEVVDANDPVIVGFEANLGRRLSEFSPIFLSIIRPGTKEITELLERQFELSDGMNRLKFQAAIPPGSYEIHVGIYSKPQLTTKFPPYYYKSCPLKVR